MSNNKQNTTQWKDTVMTFHGEQYSFLQLMVAAAAGPTISIAVQDLDPDLLNDLDPVSIQPRDPEINDHQIVFFKYDGKFVIVSGWNEVSKILKNKEQLISGRMISKHAFKNTRILPPNLAPSNPVYPTPAPAYPTRRDSTDRRPPNRAYSKNG